LKSPDPSGLFSFRHAGIQPILRPRRGTA
jgi:hypothetical protein